MADSIKVASMIASISANTTEFERGMSRAAQSAEKSFGEIEKSGQGLRGKLDGMMSNKGLFTGIKQLFTADDFAGKAGAVGIALGGWSVAIGAAVEGFKAIAPLMDEMIWGTKANTEAWAEYAREVEKVFAGTRSRRREETIAIATGAMKPPDWIDEFVRTGRDDLFWGKPEKVTPVNERIRTEMQLLRKNLEEMGTSKEFEQQRAELQAKIDRLQQAMNNRRAENIRRPIGLASDIATGILGGMNEGNLNAALSQIGQVQDGIGGFLNRYFQAQQQFTATDPFSAFARENERINKDLNAGLINEGQANVMRARARQGLDSAIPMMQPQFASLIKANSAEASKAILSSMLPKIRPEDRPLKELKEEAERQTEELKRIGDNIKNEFQVANF